ncbi:glycosyltransferase [archaeon]|nr:MAG: glycosyltransferase [archaeon]
MHAGNATEQLLFLKYAWRNGAVDWQYPIDLCAGVYRLPDIQHILDSVPKDSIHNPNAFEVMANQHFSQSSLMLDKYTHCCCPSRRMTVVVTVNKVQETYEVPVYKSPDHTLKALNAYMDRSVIPMYDVVRYCQQNYISAHVGDVFLLESDLITKKEDVLVTVLIAVYNGEKYVQECIDSLVRSQNGMVYNILVVDDGSTDSTPGILSTLQSSVAANYSSWSIKVITLDSNMGLAHALDVGLNACTTPFVARLDVDDIMLPGRLQRQLEYLQANPHIYVVGTQVYWNKESSQTFIMDTLICMKTHPILVHYDMLFRCPLLHPSVMFVRATVIEVGGYSGQTSADGNNGLVENQKYVEDYVLWTKIAAKYVTQLYSSIWFALISFPMPYLSGIHSA